MRQSLNPAKKIMAKTQQAFIVETSTPNAADLIVFVVFFVNCGYIIHVQMYIRMLRKYSDLIVF